MQIESAKAELRARPDYEAADLGLLLLRALFGPALRAWLCFVVPLQLCVLLACSSFTVGFSYLAVWWLKPVYDRAIGLVVGRGLFGDAPTVRQLYRALWREGRRGLLGDLLWRRLDPARSLVAPVALLEGLTGKAAARRRRTLGEGSTTTVLLLLSACIAIELATVCGLLVGMTLLLPEGAEFIVDSLYPDSWSTLTERASLGAYLLTIGIVEPLFVAAGFGLYINRRTNIEGWDVELTFRRMARRLALLASGVLLFSQVVSLAAEARAEAPPAAMSTSAVDDSLRLPLPEVASDGKAHDAMARVLARPDLQRVHEEERWELRSDAAKKSARPEVPAGWLQALASGIASIAVLLLWALGGLALVIVVYLILQRSQRMQSSFSEHEALPTFAALIQDGGAKQPSLATQDVVPRALALLASGQHVAALSVLYVGTLSALVRQDGLTLPVQATEGQCLSAVRSAPISQERRALFEELTQVWQLSAYAHALPEQDRLQQICGRFSVCFAGDR